MRPSHVSAEVASSNTEPQLPILRVFRTATVYHGVTMAGVEHLSSEGLCVMSDSL